MKMKKFGVCMIVVTFLVAMTWSIGACEEGISVVGAKADVTAEVVPAPPTIIKTRDLTFGTIMQGRTKKVSNHNGARFTVTGRGRIIVPKSVTLRGLIVRDAKGIIMPVSTLTAAITHDVIGTISINGGRKSIVRAGGAITVPKGQMPGKYKGALLVTVIGY